MAHDLIIIISKKNCIVTKTAQLADYCEQVDALYQNADKELAEQMHEGLERAQELLTGICAGTALGSLTLDDCIAEMEGFLGI